MVSTLCLRNKRQKYNRHGIYGKYIAKCFVPPSSSRGREIVREFSTFQNLRKITLILLKTVNETDVDATLCPHQLAWRTT